MASHAHATVLEPEQLNPSDQRILELLGEGRETTGSIADQLGRHDNYIGNRLKRLREHGHVRYHHEPTALHELVDDPRDA